MKIVNSSQIKLLDKKTIEEFGIPSLVLMERAGLEVFKILQKKYYFNKILILCGTGNNGGDGLVLARLFHSINKKVTIVLIGDNNKRTQENRHQLDLVKKLSINILDYTNDLDFNNYDLIIDSIFGVGLTRNLEGEYFEIINKANNSNSFKVAIDIPSGINADNGKILGIAFKANVTITFALPKIAHYSDQCLDYIGELHIVDIGIPEFYYENINTNLVDENFIKNIFNFERKKNSHKGTFGRHLLIGGSIGLTGAINLAIKASLISGTGLVYGIVPNEIYNILASQIPSAMIYPINDKKIYEIIENSNCISIGNGFGNNTENIKLLEYLIENYKNPLIIDADAINHISKNIETLKNRKYLTIITPHVGELSRLINVSINEIQQDRIKAISNFSNIFNNNFILVLKGAKTIISDSNNIYINSTGSPSLARGGSGDILSGIIGSMICQNNNILNSVILSVYIHGLVGEIISNKINDINIIPENIIDYIPLAFNKIGKLSNI
ncbi:MAG: bifunctional NAD(P)H-hydrate repair enzyme [Candidatus Sericytochromatia bacterium]|nr:MAG: bifunctional NAD(P)H-hydrate repair enzyme [Candidatus Sericytochromatia bacterium]